MSPSKTGKEVRCVDGAKWAGRGYAALSHGRWRSWRGPKPLTDEVRQRGRGFSALPVTSGEIGIEHRYYEYAASIAREGRARVIENTWGQVIVTLEQAGIFDSGIGVATQGAQHFALSSL